MSGISFNFLGDVRPSDKINNPFVLGLIVTLILLLLFYWNIDRDIKKSADKVYIYGMIAVTTYATSVLALLAYYNMLEHSFEVKSGSYTNNLDVKRASEIQTSSFSPNFSYNPQIQTSQIQIPNQAPQIQFPNQMAPQIAPQITPQL